jgi:hypothetical protein
VESTLKMTATEAINSRISTRNSQSGEPLFYGLVWFGFII